MPCSIREDLYRQAQEALAEIQRQTQCQLEAVAERDQVKLLHHDKEMERLIGVKERTFGALRQHTQEHGC